MPIRQKDPTCGLFFKRGLFKDISESRTVVQGLVLQLFLLQKRSFCVSNQYPQMPKWGVLGGGTHDKLEMPICGWICSLLEGCLWLWLSRKEKIFIESFFWTARCGQNIGLSSESCGLYTYGQRFTDSTNFKHAHFQKRGWGEINWESLPQQVPSLLSKPGNLN